MICDRCGLPIWRETLEGPECTCKEGPSIRPVLEATIVTDGGPWCSHDMPCAVFSDLHAVYDLNSGIFKPSWNAQAEGWVLVKVPPWVRRFLKRYERKGHGC